MSATLVRPELHHLPELKAFSSEVCSQPRIQGEPFGTWIPSCYSSLQGDLAFSPSPWMTSDFSSPTHEAQPWQSPQLLWHTDPACILEPLYLQFCVKNRENNPRSSKSSIKYLLLEFHFDLLVKIATCVLQGLFSSSYPILSAISCNVYLRFNPLRYITTTKDLCWSTDVSHLHRTISVID